MFVFTQLAADTFIRANENPLSGGGNWLVIGPSQPCQLVSNAVENNVAGNICFQAYSGGITWPNDQYSEITLHSLVDINSFLGAHVRQSSTLQTSYRAVVQGPFGTGAMLFVDKYVNGIQTEFPGSPFMFTANVGDKLRIAVVGSKLAVYLNGVLIPNTSFTDTSIVSGLPGITTFSFAPITNAQMTGWTGGKAVQTDSNSGIDGITLMNSGPEFASKISSPRTSIIGTNLGTRILK